MQSGMLSVENHFHTRRAGKHNRRACRFQKKPQPGDGPKVQMAHTSLNLFFLITLTASMLVIGALWFYYDRRDRKLYDRQRIRHVYRCIKCGRLYERRGNREVAPCPDCGFSNDRLRF